MRFGRLPIGRRSFLAAGWLGWLGAWLPGKGRAMEAGPGRSVGSPVALDEAEILEFGCVVDDFRPSAILEAMQNPLNDRPFFGAPPGTTRFDGCRTETVVTDSGDYRTVVFYTFLGDPHGWNNVLRPDGTRGRVASADGSPIYGSSDFGQLPFGPYDEGHRPIGRRGGLWPLLPSPEPR